MSGLFEKINVTYSRSMMIWNRETKDKYQVIMSADTSFDHKQFAEYLEIPSDQVGFADLDNTEDLAADFPEMKV